MAALLSVPLAGVLLTAPAVAQSGADHANNWRDEDEQLATPLQPCARLVWQFQRHVWNNPLFFPLAAEFFPRAFC
jgi:hypothetical protein